MPKQIKFVKMEGVGNDYIYLDAFKYNIKNPKELAINMSHRRFGVGSDGLIIITPSEIADAKMRMRNADGSVSEMCGNGIRCVGKYLYDYGLVSKTRIHVETGAGILQLNLTLDDKNKVKRVSVDMGKPEFSASKIPSTLDMNRVIQYEFEFDGFELKGTLISMGNPHFVTFVKDLENTPVQNWGKIIEHDPRFPSRINVEFVEIESGNRVKQRTWERGSGETWACGTGACAVCVAGVIAGKTEKNIEIQLLGGLLNLSWQDDHASVIMEGPAKEVFKGTWALLHKDILE